MADFIQNQGPLSQMSEEESPRLQAAPMSSYLSPAMAQEEEQAPEDNVSALYRQAKDRLMASRATGMDPLTTFLLAASQPGAGGTWGGISRGGIAAQEAIAQQAKSEEERRLKLLSLGIEEEKYKKELELQKAKLDAKEPKTPDLYYKVGPDGKQYGPYNINDPKEYKLFLEAPGKGFKVGTEPRPEKSEKPPRTIGYDLEGNPVTEENPGERAYMPAEYTKTLTGVRQTVDGIVDAKKTLDLVENNKSAFGIVQGLVAGLSPKIQSILPNKILTEEDRKIRARVASEAAAQIKHLFGVAVSGREKEMLRQFLPTPEDTVETLIPKLKSAYEIALQNSAEYNSEIIRKSGAKKLDSFYKLQKDPYGKEQPVESNVDENNPLLKK